MSLIDPLRPYRWAAISIVVVSLATAVIFEYAKAQNADARTSSCKADLATEKGARDADRAAAAQAVASQSEAYRVEEQRRAAAQQEIADAYEKKLQTARADRVIADAAAGRLQQRFAALLAASRGPARSSAGDPAPGTGSPSASAADLPADVLSRVLEVAGQYRDAAEDALSRGERAEQQYDSLTVAREVP